MKVEKARIILEVAPEQKKELQERAEALHLTLKDYLVLKGTNMLKEKGE